MSNGLDPDQDRRSVGPDMRPNCLQRLTTDDKSRDVDGKGRVSEMIGLSVKTVTHKQVPLWIQIN